MQSAVPSLMKAAAVPEASPTATQEGLRPEQQERPEAGACRAAEVFREVYPNREHYLRKR